MLDHDECFALLGQRDPGADGSFFVAVKTTRIYCRPICPARVPLRRNVLFYRHAGEAHAAGFRPCLRCRPESAPNGPVWVGSLTSINRALALIEDGALVEGNIEQLATRLGMTGRHLRRLFVKHLGINPIVVEQTRRVHLAKKLVHESTLSMTDIAFASGFGSLRRFNETFQKLFGRPPSSLRRSTLTSDGSERICLSLAFRPPLDWDTQKAKAKLTTATIVGEKIQNSILVSGTRITYAIYPMTQTSLALILERLPLALLGKAIAQIKRIHLSNFETSGIAEMQK
jgi:methylphosphotriester-DNA--protein-cysteine methyltransferase